MESFQYKIGIWLDEFKNKFSDPETEIALPTIGTKIFKNETLDQDENQLIGVLIMELMQLSTLIRNNQSSYNNFVNFITDID